MTTDKKRVVKTESYTEDMPPESDMIEYGDPLDEVINSNPDEVYIFKAHPTNLRTMGYVTKVSPEDLSYDFLVELLPRGRYWLQGRVGGKFNIKRSIGIENSNREPNPNLIQDSIGSANSPVYVESGNSAGMETLANTLSSIIQPIVENALSSKEDNPKMMEIMAKTYLQGMKTAQDSQPQPESTMDLIKTMKMFFEINEQFGNSQSGGMDFKDQIFSFLKPFLTKIAENKINIPDLNVNAGPSSFETTNEQATDEGIEANQNPFETARPQKLHDFVFGYTKLLSLRTSHINPILRADVFIEDVPGEFLDEFDNYIDSYINSGISEDEVFMQLTKLYPHITTNPEWFKSFWGQIFDLRTQENQMTEIDQH